MKITREEQIQKVTQKQLEDWGLCPFSIICTFELMDGSGLLAITFYLKEDVEEFLDKLDYKSQCDKTGFYVIEETNTIILTGIPLINLYANIS